MIYYKVRKLKATYKKYLKIIVKIIPMIVKSKIANHLKILMSIIKYKMKKKLIIFNNINFRLVVKILKNC